MIKSQALCHSKLSLHVTETDLGSVNFGECDIFIYLQYVFIIKSIKLTSKKKKGINVYSTPVCHISCYLMFTTIV